MTFELSPQQQEIVDHRGEHLQVIACAGSGKTESISRRVAALIGDGCVPESIVAFTFTEKAATELKDRIYRRVEEIKGAEFLGRLGPMYVGTIHGYCFRLLQDHIPRYGNFDVLDEHRHAALVSRRRMELGLDKLDHRHWKSIELFLNSADAIGNELIPMDSLDGEDIGACYTAYREMLDRFRFLTFGSIISEAVGVLERDAGAYQGVHSGLQHLIVDEYQDINPAQERLIQLLAQDPVQLCVVGDDDQAIYQWRGSDVRNIVDFARRHPDARTVKLQSNRRSRRAIVNCANTFAHSIPGRLEKAMDPVRPEAAPGVHCWMAETPDHEAELIADHIANLHNAGWMYREIAVLFRSVRTSAPILVAALGERGIPFNCGGRTGLFSHPEIDCFGELFAWMAGFSWRDQRFGPSRDADLDRVVNGLAASFGLGDGEKEDLKKYFVDWRAHHSRGNRRVSLVADFYQHLEVLGLTKIDPDTPVGSARIGAFARFSKVLADYEHVTLRSRWETREDSRREFRSGRDRGKPFWTGLANYLVHYAKESYEDFEGEETHDLDAVSILTVHQAKGLEWPIVFLPSLSSRRFPSSMAGRSQPWPFPTEVFSADKRRRYEGGDEDERRLFYVALTRARELVLASCFERLSRAVSPSPYLVELATECGASPMQLAEDLPVPSVSEGRPQAEPPPLQLGFSDLADFEDCGYEYRLGRVFGFERELATELGYGRAVHHVLRHIADEAQTTGEPPSTERIEALLNDELYVPYANAATYQNMRRNVRRLIAKYVSDWPDDLGRVWQTERAFEIHTALGTLAGRADVILDHEDGRADALAIVDYKTSTDTERQERYALQLTIYALAGRQEGLTIAASYVHELKTSRRESVNVSPDQTRAALEWTSSRIGKIRNGEFVPSPSASNCANCDFARVCAHRA